MDRNFFDQLDQLQRGAREEYPRRPTYNQTRHPLADNDVYNLGGDTNLFDDSEMYGDENAVPSNFHGMRDSVPLVHRDTDHPLGLQQSDLTTQSSQQNPFSYRGSRMHPPQYGHTQMQQTRGPSATGRFDLCRLATSWGSVSHLRANTTQHDSRTTMQQLAVGALPRLGRHFHQVPW